MFVLKISVVSQLIDMPDTFQRHVICRSPWVVAAHLSHDTTTIQKHVGARSSTTVVALATITASRRWKYARGNVSHLTRQVTGLGYRKYILS